jgi:hypothetical protein
MEAIIKQILTHIDKTTANKDEARWLKSKIEAGLIDGKDIGKDIWIKIFATPLLRRSEIELLFEKITSIEKEIHCFNGQIVGVAKVALPYELGFYPLPDGRRFQRIYRTDGKPGDKLVLGEKTKTILLNKYYQEQVDGNDELIFVIM